MIDQLSPTILTGEITKHLLNKDLQNLVLTCKHVYTSFINAVKTRTLCIDYKTSNGYSVNQTIAFLSVLMSHKSRGIPAHVIVVVEGFSCIITEAELFASIADLIYTINNHFTFQIDIQFNLCTVLFLKQFGHYVLAHMPLLDYNRVRIMWTHRFTAHVDNDFDYLDKALHKFIEHGCIHTIRFYNIGNTSALNCKTVLSCTNYFHIVPNCYSSSHNPNSILMLDMIPLANVRHTHVDIDFRNVIFRKLKVDGLADVSHFSFIWLPVASAVTFELFAMLEKWICEAVTKHGKGKVLIFELHNTRDLRVMYFFTALSCIHPSLICRLTCHSYKDWIAAQFIKRRLRDQHHINIEVFCDDSLKPVVPPDIFVNEDFLTHCILNDPELTMAFFPLMPGISRKGRS